MIVMEQYIDKSALVAEIEKLKCNLCPDFYEYNYDAAKVELLEKIEILINNLEVKEVDLEKEAELIADGIMIGVQANKYHRCVYNTTKCDFNHSHLMLAARKGIEVGLKAAQKGK
jgi:hypothetical protein